MEEHLIETWLTHNRINLYLLDNVTGDALQAISASKGRSVAEQFAHLHNVRLMWLKVAAPDLLAGLEKIQKEEAANKPFLHDALIASGQAIAGLLKKGLMDGGKIKGFKPHVTAFLGYIISHESHHRGQIVLTLKQAKHPVDKKVAYGLWEWGVR